MNAPKILQFQRMVNQMLQQSLVNNGTHYHDIRSVGKWLPFDTILKSRVFLSIQAEHNFTCPSLGFIATISATGASSACHSVSLSGIPVQVGMSRGSRLGVRIK